MLLFAVYVCDRTAYSTAHIFHVSFIFADGLMQHLVTAVAVRHPMLEWAPHLPQKSNLALHVLRFIGSYH
jgi:hypothetical protein